ncbi:NEUFC protein, partial [Polyodon spathula]|nr:NEUFC protein [Polyodon spathula]
MVKSCIITDTGQSDAARDTVRLLDLQELSRYNGQQGSPGVYLSILGQVFDVGKGHKHYGPGGSYHFFAGRDASRAFVTGDFTEAGLVDDVSGLSPGQILSLSEWLSFYNKDYVLVGRLVGRYYSETGEPTEALKQVESAMVEGLELRAQAEADKQRFPPCNSEWSAGKGGRVWCSTQSGGVQRDWVGVPRKLFKPGSSSQRCVCVQSSRPTSSQAQASQQLSDRGDLDNPNLQEYQGCPSLAESCLLTD